MQAARRPTIRQRLIRFGLLLIYLVSLLSPVRPAFAENDTYVVKDGESLSLIAETLNVSLDALMAANGIENPDLIYAGQTLKVPGSSSTASTGVTSAPASGSTYEIQPGDTLSGIAEKFGVSVRSLVEANSLDDPAHIVAGTTLKIPASDYTTGNTRAAATPTPTLRSVPTATPSPTQTPTPTASPTLPPPTRSIPEGQAEIFFYCIKGRMANGEMTHMGAAAADWNVFPQGTRIRIEGLWDVTIKDKIGGPQGLRRIDVWVESCESAIKMGTFLARYTILK
jgi:LysM repeat protein